MATARAGRNEPGDYYRLACGQSVKNLSPEKLRATLAKQESALRKRLGDSEIRFRVVVENGKAKLKASRDG